MATNLYPITQSFAFACSVNLESSRLHQQNSKRIKETLKTYPDDDVFQTLDKSTEVYKRGFDTLNTLNTDVTEKELAARQKAELLKERPAKSARNEGGRHGALTANAFLTDALRWGWERDEENVLIDTIIVSVKERPPEDTALFSVAAEIRTFGIFVEWAYVLPPESDPQFYLTSTRAEPATLNSPYLLLLKAVSLQNITRNGVVQRLIVRKLQFQGQPTREVYVPAKVGVKVAIIDDIFLYRADPQQNTRKAILRGRNGVGGQMGAKASRLMACVCVGDAMTLYLVALKIRDQTSSVRDIHMAQASWDLLSSPLRGSAAASRGLGSGLCTPRFTRIASRGVRYKLHYRLKPRQQLLIANSTSHPIGYSPAFHRPDPLPQMIDFRVRELRRLISEEQFSHQKPNIELALKRYENGDLPKAKTVWFVNGQVVDYVPEPPPASSAVWSERTASQMGQSASYGHIGTDTTHSILAVFQLPIRLGGVPNLNTNVVIVNDTGSDTQAIFNTDLVNLAYDFDIYSPLTYQGHLRSVQIQTPNIVMHRELIAINIRLLKPDGTRLSAWFSEFALIAEPQLNRHYCLSGSAMRDRLYLATVNSNELLYVSENKNGIAAQLPAALGEEPANMAIIGLTMIALHFF
ncbi:MAG: hypothetical protein M1819_006976 [Sarea resinae]|nr:MAG: hypothetical protein M1819_006976 [Sarea resinae]